LPQRLRNWLPDSDRCPSRLERCSEEPPALAVEAGHVARCWLLERRP